MSTNKIRRFRRARFEHLETRALLAAEVLRLSPSYLESLNLVEREFIERVRNADRNQDDLVSARDALASIDDPARFDETIGVIEDWLSEVSDDLARRLHSLDPERWASLGEPTGDPPGGGELPPPGGGGPPLPGPGTWHGSNPGGGHPVDIYGITYEFDLDAAIVQVANVEPIPTHTPTGVLPEGVEDSEGAWVLANYDNDDFNEVDTQGNPIQGEDPQDELQSSPVAGEDDLMPVVLRANASFPDGVYFVTHSGGIRVYEDAQKTRPANRMYPSGADTQLFVEALSPMVANQINFDHLHLNYADPFFTFVLYEVDSIRINRFIISGPTSVPIGSRYIYNAIGVDPTISNWVNPTQGTKTPVQWEHAASFNDWQEILWSGDGKSVEKAVYELPNGYQWGFDVARVSISWDTGVLAYNGRVEQSGMLAATTAEYAYVAGAPGTQAPMMAIAHLLVEGPKKNNRVRGSGEIEVGFVQNATFITQEALYGETPDEKSITWNFSFPMNVPVLDTFPGNVWYDPTNGTGDWYHTGNWLEPDGQDFKSFETYNAGTGVDHSAAKEYWIDMGDGPRLEFAPHWTDKNFTENPLERTNGKVHFNLYIAARTKQAFITSTLHTPAQFLNVSSIDNPGTAIHPYDPTLICPPWSTLLNSSDLYFQQANTNWDFVFDGSVTGQTWTKAAGSGLSGLYGFNNFQGDGKLVPRTTGPVGVTLVGESEWIRSVSP